MTGSGGLRASCSLGVKWINRHTEKLSQGAAFPSCGQNMIKGSARRDKTPLFPSVLHQQILMVVGCKTLTVQPDSWGLPALLLADFSISIVSGDQCTHENAFLLVGCTKIKPV